MISLDPQSFMIIFTYISARELHSRTEEDMLRITLPNNMVEGFKQWGDMAVEIAIEVESVTNALKTKLNDTEAELKIEV